MLKLWPAEFSPLLFFTLEGGKDALHITSEFLHIVDPDTASRMGAWLALIPGEPIPTSLGSPLANFLFAEINLQVRMVSLKRYRFF